MDWLAGPLAPEVAALLLAMSFVGSFVTVAAGIGGGALLLAVMASTMPPAALIPVHGVIQLASNGVRLAIMRRHLVAAPLWAFGIGTALGVALGGSVAVALPAWGVQLGVGAFVAWSVLARPPRWLSRGALATGAISSALTMFFGATGVFVANFTKALSLGREAHVATHAAMMTLQHGLKVVAFGLLGFAFAPWAGFLAGMIASGALGTVVGRRVLLRISDRVFKRALDVVLLLLSARLVWAGLAGAWAALA